MAVIGLAAPLIALAACNAHPTRQADPSTRSAATSAAPVTAPVTAPVMGTPSGSGTSRTRLTGHFIAEPVEMEGTRLGLVTVTGFVGNSNRVTSWQDRSTDGGRHWTAGPVSRTGDGLYPRPVASTQIGLAFASPVAGWAFQTSLFFTRNGGLTWQPEPGRPAAVGPVAVSGDSTWVTSYPCRSFHCQPRLLQTGLVGGRLTPLPAQPTRTRDIATLVRPDRTTAWVTTEDQNGYQQLVTTADGGHHWQRRAVPCSRHDSYTVAGAHPAGMYLICALPPTNMCEACGARVLYRSRDDGVSWTRITPTPTPLYGSHTPAAFVQPTGNRTLWATSASQIGSGTVLRSTDDGRRWHAVLGTAAHPLAIEGLVATTSRRALLVTMSSTRARGVGFTIYRTTDGGLSWHDSELPIPTTLG